MAWKIGIAAGFAVLFSMNAIYIYFAISGAEPVDPTYNTEHR